MKKIVGTIAAVAVAAGVAFADVGIGSWGRAVWTPVAYDDADGKVKSWEGISWGGNFSRVGITVHAESENVGFALDMNADNYSSTGIGVHDIAHFWAKPWSWLEVKVGKTQDDTGRGNIAYGMFNWKRMGAGWTGEDVTFTRFGNGGGGQAQGAILKVTPVEGLWAIAAFDVQDNGEAVSTFGNHAQYGIGYEIDGIGHIRAQYIGGKNTTDVDGSTVPEDQINAAFDLAAVENLYLTVGAYIPLHLNRGNVAITDKIEDTIPQVKLAVGASYKVAAVTFNAFFVGNLPNTIKFGGSEVTKDFNCQVGVGADVDLGNGIGLVADVRFSSANSYSYSSTTLKSSGEEVVFLVGASKALTNGSIGIGFQGDINTVITSDFKDNSNTRFNWCIPVVISASF
ncbi:MAG: hypothetical protein SOX64_11180 [Treponema sp.]|nr:hypothetical protein [Spirochaetia bacterium]MDY4211969.1 hypothetical protein [Treponema sp.]